MTHETSAYTPPSKMLAAVYDRFGGPDVVRLADVPVPRPGPNDILIRVVASTVSAADHRMRARDLPPGIGLLAMPVVGLFRPRRRILGMDFAGTVVAVGNAVTRFAPGDDVVGMTGSAFGGHAEFLMLPQSAAIATRPADLGHEEALALVFGGHTISECIRRREIRPGDDVLVNGASGAVGSVAIQVAKHFGAHVTAVASADNAGLLARLGADRVIYYRAEDFSTGSETYDIIFDCVGNAPFERFDRVLKPGGALLQVAADFKALVSAKGHTRRSGKLVAPITFTPAASDVAFATRLYREGGLKPVIDRTYRFDEIVEAHRYVDTGRKRGSVIVQIAPPHRRVAAGTLAKAERA
ncbi:MAG: NAD(P)-dependent alcohol dehydrogenase [Devosia sp.]|nr:NAD(P)-dependent alcohol dehydrogenase [Devosia sp.]